MTADYGPANLTPAAAALVAETLGYRYEPPSPAALAASHDKALEDALAAVTRLRAQVAEYEAPKRRDHDATATPGSSTPPAWTTARGRMAHYAPQPRRSEEPRMRFTVSVLGIEVFSISTESPPEDQSGEHDLNCCAGGAGRGCADRLPHRHQPVATTRGA